MIRLVNLMPRWTQQGQTGPQAQPWADGILLKSFEVDLSLRFGEGSKGLIYKKINGGYSKDQ